MPSNGGGTKNYHVMNTNTTTTVTKSEIVEDARFTTSFGQSINIGYVKKISNICEVFISPDGISRHKTVRKIYIIDELVEKINGGKYIGH